MDSTALLSHVVAPGTIVNSDSNPILPDVPAADPDLCCFGDRYYLYATGAGKGERGFTAWSSPDLKAWRCEGMILRFADVAWAVKDDWAPAVVLRNGRFYLYFCADSQIGVAVADSPVGPFQDALGKPLVEFEPDLSSIDPMVFTDDDGQSYFYWGALPGHWLENELAAAGKTMHLSLFARRLNSDLLGFEGETVPTISTRKSRDDWHVLDHIEAPFLLKRAGIYYLQWSPGHYTMHSDEDDMAYRVHYATSQSPLGPWQIADNNPILSSRPELGILATGHHSVLRIPGASDDWVCAYHANAGDGDRRVYLDEMRFAPDGCVEIIEPNTQGIKARPIRLGLKLGEIGSFAAGQKVRIHALNPLGEVWTQVEFFSHSDLILTRVNPQFYSKQLALELADLPVGFHRVWARGTTSGGEIWESAPLDFDVVSA